MGMVVVIGGVPVAEWVINTRVAEAPKYCLGKIDRLKRRMDWREIVDWSVMICMPFFSL